ncbi:MAG: MlaD family protein [Verrucomicrobiota bacterium]
MSTKANNVRIGFFVLGSIALLVAGLLAFGARSLFTAKNLAETAILGDVAGLSVGSAVELRGVPIGKVSRIGFDWSLYPGATNGYIIVEFEVEQHILPSVTANERGAVLKREIKRGLRAIVKGQGITGTCIVSLDYLDPDQYPPPEIDFTPNHFYIPSAPSQFTRLLEAIEKSLHDVEQIDFVAVTKGVTNVLSGMTRMTEELEHVNLTSIGTNANALLIQLNQVVMEVKETIKGMHLDKTGRNADALITGLQQTNDKLQVLLNHANQAPVAGTIDDIRQAVRTLNEVLIELKQYPSGFIFGAPPIPASSVRPETH